MNTSFTIDGMAVKIIRKPIKNLYLRLDSSGQAVASVPLAMPQEEIMAFLASKQDWLRQKLDRINAAPPLPADQAFIWGELRPIRLVPTANEISINYSGAEILLHAPAMPATDIMTQIISCLHRQLTLAESRPLLEKWRRHFRLPPLELVCRTMKSKWGSCIAAKNKVTINGQLASFPKPCLEMVIVHELTHFFEHNHGKGFYRRLEKALPDWRQRAQILKAPLHGNGENLPEL